MLIRQRFVLITIACVLAGVIYYVYQKSMISGQSRPVTIHGSFVLVSQTELKSEVENISSNTRNTEEFISQVSKLLAGRSYIESHTIRLSWPNRIDITINEIVPVARLGIDRLIDSSCGIHQVDDMDSYRYLVRFDHAEGISMDEVCSGVDRIAGYLKSMPVGSVTLYNNGDYKIHYSGVDYMVSGVNLESQITKLHMVHRLVNQQSISTKYIDLRYSSGGALSLI